MRWIGTLTLPGSAALGMSPGRLNSRQASRPREMPHRGATKLGTVRPPVPSGKTPWTVRIWLPPGTVSRCLEGEAIAGRSRRLEESMNCALYSAIVQAAR